MSVEKNISISKNLKKEYRDAIIKLFLDEEPGERFSPSIYYYFVETLSDGRRIYLKRPTQLNKGVDFEVRVENTHFRYGKYGNEISTGNRPSHEEIKQDLEKKKEENLKQYQQFLKLLDKIYRCEDVTIEEINRITFKNSLSPELILKVIKWLLIEQDVTYWNRSGREMLYLRLTE